ncbi:MAG: hypothetical protein QM484_09835 [Woeseiaceae bacterium]
MWDNSNLDAGTGIRKFTASNIITTGGGIDSTDLEDTFSGTGLSAGFAF